MAGAAAAARSVVAASCFTARCMAGGGGGLCQLDGNRVAVAALGHPAALRLLGFAFAAGKVVFVDDAGVGDDFQTSAWLGCHALVEVAANYLAAFHVAAGDGFGHVAAHPFVHQVAELAQLGPLFFVLRQRIAAGALLDGQLIGWQEGVVYRLDALVALHFLDRQLEGHPFFGVNLVQLGGIDDDVALIDRFRRVIDTSPSGRCAPV